MSPTKVLAQRHRFGAPFLVVAGILLREPRGDHVEVLLRLRDGHARLEPP
jgi:hypothetical protein